AYNNRTANYNAWFAAIDHTTRQLWDLLMEPVITHLKSLDVAQAVLIPTGYLSFLPLHAAWVEDATTPTGRRYAQDTITFTYVPNARSLRAARDIADRTAATSLLAINEPRPTKQIALPNSEREIEAALAYFPDSPPLKHEQASRKAVLDALPHCNLLHFSCHGYANFDNPLDSGLLLANDEVLSLRDCFNLQLQGIRLAILSACETGLPGTKLPDEVISLPTGLLQAGVAGVAASLWSVADLSTTLLLVRFYDFWRNDHLASAEALRQAQHWLRDTTNGQKLNYFEQQLANAGNNPSAADNAEWWCEYFFRQKPGKLEDRSFAHPFHWAAFTYVGV
ncbi:MAG: CHAT domain-containing protein, partial [Cyanobacteria bacterium J06638_6]